MDTIIRVQNISKEELFSSLENLLDKKLREVLSNRNLNEKLSIKEVALELGVAELTIHNYIKKGKVRALKIGRRIFITRNDLDLALNEVKSLKYKR